MNDTGLSVLIALLPFLCFFLAIACGVFGRPATTSPPPKVSMWLQLAGLLFLAAVAGQLVLKLLRN